MADRRQQAVMGLSIHVDHTGAAGLPGAAYQVRRLRAVFGKRRQDHGAPLVQARISRVRPRAFGARDGMARHKTSDTAGQRLARRVDDFGLGATRVGQYRRGAQMRQHPSGRRGPPRLRR
ncbi:hypothetical protein G6F65_022652 [Rhizopus arrhizus]|nr:hypothetical protein G6F65_022652 [Rhizopus arrhizus]